MNIYLIRHGTTEWNSQHLIQGRTDISLDETGEKMAAQTGRMLAEKKVVFSRIYSSPLKRAVRTAELICPAAGAYIPADTEERSAPEVGLTGGNEAGTDFESSICTDDRLTELCFGCFEGRNVEEMLADPACPFRYFKNDPFRYNDAVKSMRSGIMETATSDLCEETLDELLLRTSDFIHTVIEPLVREAAEDTSESSSDINILICGHGALNKALMMNFCGKNDLHEFWGIGLQPNCGINKISCTCSPSGDVIYSVQEENFVLYDENVASKVTKLL